MTHESWLYKYVETSEILLEFDPRICVQEHPPILGWLRSTGSGHDGLMEPPVNMSKIHWTCSRLVVLWYKVQFDLPVKCKKFLFAYNY